MVSFLRAVGNLFSEKKDQATKVISDDVRDGKYAIEDYVGYLWGCCGFVKWVFYI